MADETKVFVTVAGAGGKLVIDGPLPLLRELLGSFSEHAATAPPPPPQPQSSPSPEAAQ